MKETEMLPAVAILCPCAQAPLPVPAPDKAYEDQSSIIGSIDSQTEANQTARQSVLTAIQAVMTHVKLGLSAKDSHYCSRLALVTD